MRCFGWINNHYWESLKDKELQTENLCSLSSFPRRGRQGPGSLFQWRDPHFPVVFPLYRARGESSLSNARIISLLGAGQSETRAIWRSHFAQPLKLLGSWSVAAPALEEEAPHPNDEHPDIGNITSYGDVMSYWPLVPKRLITFQKDIRCMHIGETELDCSLSYWGGEDPSQLVPRASWTFKQFCSLPYRWNKIHAWNTT